MADEIGGHHRNKAALGHDACLDVVELQPGVGTCHLACGEAHSVYNTRQSRKKLFLKCWHYNPTADGTQDDLDYCISYLRLSHCQQTAAGFCPFAPPSRCATRCHSASAPQTASPVLCLLQRKGTKDVEFKIINDTKGKRHAICNHSPRHMASFFLHSWRQQKFRKPAHTTMPSYPKVEMLLAWGRKEGVWQGRMTEEAVLHYKRSFSHFMDPHVCGKCQKGFFLQHDTGARTSQLQQNILKSLLV